jgi:hypothetical protein
VTVSISDLLGNAIDGKPRCLEQINRAFDPKILNVLDGRFAEYFIQTTRQRPLGGGQCVGNRVERDCGSEMFSHPPIKTLNERVRMRKVIRDGIGRLRKPRIEDEVFRYERGKLGAVVTDEP